MRKLMNNQNTKWLQKLPFQQGHCPSINKGPFISAPMYSVKGEEYISKNHFKNSVLKSFQLSFTSFLKALSSNNIDRIHNLTRPALADQLTDYLSYLKEKNKKIILNNIDDFSISIENIVGLKYIYGIPLEYKDKQEQYRLLEMGGQKQNKIHRVYYVNKNVLKHQREKLILVDVVLSTNLTPSIQSIDSQQQQQKQQEIQSGQSQNSLTQYQYTNFLVQFITSSKYQNLEVPFVVDEEKWGELLGDEFIPEVEGDVHEITQLNNNSENEKFQNIVNVHFNSESKQQQYEQFGWKINNINSYIHQPTVYHAV